VSPLADFEGYPAGAKVFDLAHPCPTLSFCAGCPRSCGVRDPSTALRARFWESTGLDVHSSQLSRRRCVYLPVMPGQRYYGGYDLHFIACSW
jgi:hypothetical protein